MKSIQNIQARFARFSASRGFTLVELMVAMLLGLIVIAGVASVFVVNLQSYHSNTALSEVQTNARIAYAMMARDIRQAGLTGCNSKNGRLGNVLKNGPYNGGSTYWANFNNALHGYDPSQVDPAVTGGIARAASTGSVLLMYADGEGHGIASASSAAASLTLSSTATDLAKGDIVIVCDPDHATLAQISAFDGTTGVTHAADVGTPGNCAKGLGYVTSCADTTGNLYDFQANARLSRLAVHDWYIGEDNGIRSLYRMSLVNVSGVPTPQVQEMVRNVTDMQLDYHQSGGADFVSASSVANWSTVDAVRVRLTLESSDQRAGVDNQPLKRTFTTTTTLRNRVP